jgi:hypothetical protein
MDTMGKVSYIDCSIVSKLLFFSQIIMAVSSVYLMVTMFIYVDS